MIHPEFESCRVREIHSHRNYEFFCVMQGSCTLTLEDEHMVLSAGDFLMINSGLNHGFSVGEDSLVGRFHIPYGQVVEEGGKTIFFDLDSRKTEKYMALEKLRRILKEILEGTGASMGDLIRTQRYFALMEVLLENFAHMETTMEESPTDMESDRRICEIMEYIRGHFRENISLNVLAKRLYLSPAYLSKYIKQSLGMNFVDLVNQTRLNHAATALENQALPVANVALDAGFSNMASFNRSFKERYGCTPTQYRKRLQAAALSDEAELHVQPLVQNDRNSGIIYKEISVDERRMGSGLLLKRHWNQTINIGSAEELLHSDVQNHVLALKNQLHFRYVRFWDLYSPALYLDEHEPGEIYNFSRLDRVLDFLVENHLVPHMEVGNKPKKLMREQRDDMLHPKKGDSPLKSEESMRYFFSALMRHLMRRYGVSELEKWVMELWMEEDEEYSASEWPEYTPEMIQEYLRRFEILAETVRRFGARIHLGGGGFGLRYGTKWFDYIIHSWKDYEQRPDFVSIYVYPFELSKNASSLNNHALRLEYLRESMDYAMSVLEREKMKCRLCVTEWNITVFNRSPVNDSLYKGAWIVKNLMDSMNRCDTLAYWVGSDLYAECYDVSGFISGSCGLMTRDGLKKPAWYAFEFMNSLERTVYKKEEQAVITRGKYKDWRIVCHNFKPMNYSYYLQPEDSIAVGDIHSYSADSTPLRLYFEIPVQEGDVYRVKFLRVNQNSGSVQDAWLAMSAPDYLDGEDIAYLKNRCIPQVTIRSYKEKGGKLAFTTALEPNEIQLILVDFSCNLQVHNL